MDVSIVIISYNTCALLQECLSSIYEKTMGVTYEIFVVDNASSDGSCEMVEMEFTEVCLIRNSENYGFAKANNQAIKKSRGKYVLLLNSDTILDNNALQVMFEFMEKHPRAAVCGPLLLNADKSVQRSIDRHPTVTSLILRLSLGVHRDRYRSLLRDKYHPSVFGYSKSYQVSDGWLTGAALMIRKAAFEDIGLFDEQYFFAMEDADWGFAASQEGWETWFVPEAAVTHHRGASGKSSLGTEDEIRNKVSMIRQNMYFVRKNYGLFNWLSFRVLLTLILAVNLIRHILNHLPLSNRHEQHSLFKRRLAWKLLLGVFDLQNIKRH